MTTSLRHNKMRWRYYLILLLETDCSRDSAIYYLVILKFVSLGNIQKHVFTEWFSCTHGMAFTARQLLFVIFGNEIHHHCRKVLYDIVSYSTSLTQYPAVCLVIQIIIDLQLGNVTYDAQPPLRIFFSRIRRCYRQQIQSSRGCMQHSLCILRSFFGRILARHKSDHRMRTSSVPTTSKRLCKCDIISFVSFTLLLSVGHFHF